MSGPGCWVLRTLSLSLQTQPHLCTWPKDALTVGQCKSAIQPEREDKEGHEKGNYSCLCRNTIACRPVWKM